ncbi:MAG: VCBS repeat-containing protein [Bacteroidales bacterium]|nr:VCBS repeat-containing protein [Bacteroidales bacterium]MDD2425395.1 VCBS repeat-containing protein [Bacteroidales bacterium]MDD3988823.1 VCBS repeat-containing protein [Bacteroidales bacterium]
MKTKSYYNILFLRDILIPSRLVFLLIFIGCFFISSSGQSNDVRKNSSLSLVDFPKLIFAEIPGAPKLSAPQLIMGKTEPLMSEGMGWAAPAVYDWNGHGWNVDGKKDLLIGEFGSGLENKERAVGNFVRVYRNIGTDKEPRFSDNFEYARPKYSAYSVCNGTPLSIYTHCCFGFTPQIVDLNDDGYQDIATGQYSPGEVTCFLGSEEGFSPGEKLPQEGNPNGEKDSNLPLKDVNSWSYWSYSAVSFGDFDGDGDYDMIVGGSALRLSKNIGSKTSPKFAYREFLLDTEGNPLRVYEPTGEKLGEIKEFLDKYPAGVANAVPHVVDWDNDGVLDLLVTNGYLSKGSNAVLFFRGVQTTEGYRCEKGIPLFTTKDDSKAFPGSWLRVFVTDWNNDGVNDLLIGTSVATTNGGQFNYDLSWKWERDTDIIKENPGVMSQDKVEAMRTGNPDSEGRRYRFSEYLNKGGDPTLVHRGYVYLMLGKK